MKVGILGATGYAGQEIVRLLHRHGEVEKLYLGSSSAAGEDYESIYPHWQDQKVGILQDETIPELDVLFCALPHGLTAQRTSAFLKQNIKVIDLGADFRLNSADLYEEWYKIKHPAAELLKDAVYGLPEIYRDQIKGKSLIANPGCYPTATLLALVPLLRKQLLQTSFLVIDAKSGVSGAGRGVSLGMHYSEVNENFKAYGVASHRHTPEIEQELSRASGQNLTVNFTPHLVPMTRGMLVTIYGKVSEGVQEDDLRECWQAQYEEEEFVHLLPPGTWPQTKFSSGSNHAFLQLTLDKRTGNVVIVSVIDNLMKGAAGQAVQNMNIIMGWQESLGLKGTAMWP
ncbi:N-acetyl-gamma-glutamyl-phosphate reductase, common form [Desulfosporosinus orientis DSM 765]|uniref:N-acetyl-gamma-glutamyl-phosphate reductase n=1 Tax=Desulfosporosinus orientis (strain ATCC 19365 / DSM 765 / NCIMB 8382 / VKM B-1628 / Singapore I) TaxID=768706 RepID=G7WA07_DESOD|nr:N-acetyl-gamma-glutamyl-phosphate reductase [Desulfosporosinus orientis]AET66003.1 N-acetyl-gamma-glutamyl-phosphate reductase, common form [Desulfosporosinus orientis DSM 765]